ncbi:MULTISPECIES: CpsD/CapB family tyrosine-protein kinase [unclassified Ruegeria]|uniref:CpsD/CapB family tyrosine-protein kinase n=1 Tax=unclassified Ruegeria TaxID=2625375 RepID=UPI001487E8D1|nr:MULTISPECIES: CpsD/CapB family tyrosine-protein kinase [unclassified Ruegeria]
MEKLQAAIEKARVQRQESQTINGHPVQKPEVVNEPVKTPEEAVNSAWASLAQAELNPRILRKNRMVAYSGGEHAAPYDMLRTRILQLAQLNDWKRIAIVSPHSGCGKSTTVSNLVFSFERQADLRTMVLDCDLRRTNLARLLGLQPKSNMKSVFEGKVDFAEHGIRIGENVILGANDAPVGSSAEVLQSQSTGRVLNTIEAAYKPDIMLFDMPPLLVSDDNFAFLKNVDCALLMVEADKTSVKQVDIAERHLAELTNVMGVILNKCHYSDTAYGY